MTNTLLELLITIEHVVEREFYLKQLAERLKLPEHIIREQWQAVQKKHAQSQLQSHRRKETSEEEKKTEQTPDEDDGLGEYLLQILLRHPLPKDLSIDSAWITEIGVRRILEHLHDWNKTHDSFSLAAFTAHLPDELQETVSTLYLNDFPVEDKLIDRELRVTITQLQQRWRRKRLTEISTEIGALEHKDELTAEEEKTYNSLQKELQSIMQSPA